MIARNVLKTEIDHIDERYLELVYKIVRQFHRVPEKTQAVRQGQTIANIFQEIADSGGLDISDPLAWQRELRQDRPLPFREN